VVITSILLGIITGSNNNNNNNINNNSLLAPGDTGKLGTNISVVRVETAHGNNLAARWSDEYPFYLMGR
jgi:hypothetical protein